MQIASHFKKYTTELIAEINKLQYSAESHRVSDKASIRQFGYNARRINYKKIGIIYTIQNKTVIIHRIVPASLISEDKIIE